MSLNMYKSKMPKNDHVNVKMIKIGESNIQSIYEFFYNGNLTIL